MREYETLFIIQPEISDEGTASILARLDEALEKGGATRLLCEDMGKRKLAYEIDNFHKGHYHVLRYLDGGRVVPEIERLLRLEESVLRFLTVLVDEEVADVEARKAAAREEEADQSRRAAERAEREAEEARARAEAELEKAKQEAEAAAEAAARAEAAAQQAAAEAGTEAEAAAGAAAGEAPAAGAGAADDAQKGEDA